MDLQTNPELELASDYVLNTNQCVFLTGKAGSGKTTFLHQIQKNGSKRIVVVAPTGVAAINAGGMTIHSLFQLPFGLFLPGVERSNPGQQRRFSRKKIRLIQSLDLLVIDEISMVRADLLDAVDDVLRRYRNPRLPFGGVQLLMIGDLHQLPPVVKPEDWDLLSRHYETPFFFSSQALQQSDYIAIELKHIYRQSDAEFIGLLNRVRDSDLDEDSLRKLNSRFVPGFQPPDSEAYITLTATNAAAHQINSGSLARLQAKEHVFRASIDGQFSETAYPTDEVLKCKVGAQVMFIRNDTESDRRYFNGKIGRITEIDDDSILVRCPGDPTTIAVNRAEWQNVKYSLNEESKQIEEEVLGTFVQYPLKLAWAITIHKSQGLTFERAIIDAQAAFASGQVYVALSRCKSFDGIVLRSRIDVSSVKTDPRVKQYSADAARNLPDESQLKDARRRFHSDMLRELFAFDWIQNRVEQLRSMYATHAGSLAPQASEQMQAFAERAKSDLFAVSQRFAPQLSEYLDQDEVPASNVALQARIRGASTYFTEKLTGLLDESHQLSSMSDNREVASSLAKQLEAIQSALFVKRGCFAACSNGFTADSYNRARIDAELDFTRRAPASSRKLVVPKGVPHPDLYRQLLQWRQQTAEEDKLSLSGVVPALTLKELVTYLPTNNSRLSDIRGIGKARLKRYGPAIIKLIQDYLDQHQIEADDSIKASQSRKIASDTQRQSFALFQSGKSLDEVATERGLARGTIEGHLAHFIGTGELDVYLLVDRETVETIEQFVKSRPEATLSEIKSHFGEKYSYSELKLAISHIQKE